MHTGMSVSPDTAEFTGRVSVLQAQTHQTKQQQPESLSKCHGPSSPREVVPLQNKDFPKGQIRLCAMLATHLPPHDSFQREFILPEESFAKAFLYCSFSGAMQVLEPNARARQGPAVRSTPQVPAGSPALPAHSTEGLTPQNTPCPPLHLRFAVQSHVCWGWAPHPGHNLPASWELPRGRSCALPPYPSHQDSRHACHPLGRRRSPAGGAGTPHTGQEQLGFIQVPCSGENTLRRHVDPSALFSFPTGVYVRTPAVRELIKLSHCGRINVSR